MKSSELLSKSSEELLSILSEQKKEYFNLRFQKKLGQLNDTSRLKIIRRKIAKTLTVLNKKKYMELSNVS